VTTLEEVAKEGDAEEIEGGRFEIFLFIGRFFGVSDGRGWLRHWGVTPGTLIWRSILWPSARRMWRRTTQSPGMVKLRGAV
jgi:hypothetical protein